MVTLNSNYVIQRKSDGAALSTVSITAFWSAVGARDPFDPHVLYDPYSDRWLVSAADDPLLATSAIYYGVSDTADPQGSWHMYAIDADPTDATWADYPTIGFSRGSVAIGVNMFATGTLKYVRGRVIALDYDALRAGGAGNPVDISVPGGFALQPAITNSPTEKTLYVVEHVESTAGTYRLWSIDGKTLTLVGGAAKMNPLGVWTSPGPGNVLPQQYGPGIDTGDSRIGNAVFRNGHIYYAQTIGMPAGGLAGFVLHTGVQWVELDTNGDFVQGGRIEDPVCEPVERRPLVRVRVDRRELPPRRARRLLRVPVRRLRRRRVRVPSGNRSAEHAPRADQLKQGQGPYVKTARNRTEPLGGLQQLVGRSLGRPVALDAAGVHPRSRRQGRAVRPLGRVVGESRRRVARRAAHVHRPPGCLGRTLREARRGPWSAGQCRVGTVRHVKSTAKTGGVGSSASRPGPRTTLDANAPVALWLGKGR